MMMKKMTGKGTFIIAEISANHGGNFKRAVRLIKKARECGADAVKFQAYTPDTLTIKSDHKHFRIEHSEWGGQTLYQLYKKAHTPPAWFRELKNIADDIGIPFFATAFDRTAVDLLEQLEVPMHKISSFELVDLPLVEYAAKTGKPLVLSTGMATVTEIEEAVNAARCAGAKEVILLKCVSSYPAKPEEMNLRTIAHMREMFKCPVGLSDHTLGIGVPVAAAALGAQMIEKHFTLSREAGTPDSFFSTEPREFKEMVDNIRMAEKALGKVHYGLTGDERKSRIFRRSLFVVKDVEKGETFTDENVSSIRPASGIAPKYLKTVLGKKARQNIKMGTPLSTSLIN